MCVRFRGRSSGYGGPNRIRAGAQATAEAMEKVAGQLEQEHAPMRSESDGPGGEDADVSGADAGP